MVAEFRIGRPAKHSLEGKKQSASRSSGKTSSLGEDLGHLKLAPIAFPI